MSGKYKKFLALLILILISNTMIIKLVQFDAGDPKFVVDVKTEKEQKVQLFYAGNGEGWSEEKSLSFDYKNTGKYQEIEFFVPKKTTSLRLDLGSEASCWDIKKPVLKTDFSKLDLTDQLFGQEIEEHQIEKKIKDIQLQIHTSGDDPYLVFDHIDKKILELDQKKKTADLSIKIISCVLIDVLLFIVLKKSKSVLQLARELYQNRELIWSLAKNDFKTKYAGSYLGIIWAFIQPIVTILIYWFVFGFGLKAGSPIEGVPFIFWFMAGLIPWFFFQDSLMNSTNCMVEYSYLVKKVVFKISILPIIKILSSLFVHIVFLIVLLIIGVVYHFYPTVMTIQLVYYSFCTFFLVLGISYATSAIVLFFKDLMQLIVIFLQIGMWMTPIMWSYTLIPEKYQWIAKLNPFYYIAEGYRDTLINHVWFWQRYFQTIYFWIIALAFFAGGAIIFKKLKPHFSDVL